jgi:hypothetical protein
MMVCRLEFRSLATCIEHNPESQVEMKSRLHRRAAYCVLFVAFVGCGGSKLSPVEGVVLLDGKPVVGATVQFVPQGAGRDATAETDESGRFSMSTNQPRDGMVPGTYKVVISPPLGTADTATYSSSEDAMSAAAKVRPKTDAKKGFPQQYTRPDLTPLTQEVPTKGSLKFELKS